MSTVPAKSLPPIAVTMGDPAGIGPDIALACWQNRNKDSLPPFVIVGDPKVLGTRAQALGLELPIAAVESPIEGFAVFREALGVIPAGSAGDISPGKPTAKGGAAAVASIESAVALVQRGEARAVVTNPINKAQLYDVGFAYPGHTEFLAALAQASTGKAVEPVMMLVCDELKVVPATLHVALKDVGSKLSRDLIGGTIRITDEGLRSYFGIPSPRIAVAGLNPHAGEAGTMGREELDIIAPAIEQARAAGIRASGPFSADTMFHRTARQDYDAAVAMYHDQALIPIKTLAFERAVNLTLGLPFIRTSPDHGTAYGLAGSGKADPNSLLEALKLADSICLRLAAVKA
jgi:4-hydroxythreonine-4-phosphate dehydrogenase